MLPKEPAGREQNQRQGRAIQVQARCRHCLLEADYNDLSENAERFYFEHALKYEYKAEELLGLSRGLALCASIEYAL